MKIKSISSQVFSFALQILFSENCQSVTPADFFYFFRSWIF